MDPKSFGSYLKSLRNAKGLSMGKLAKLAGVSQPYISQIENGQRGIPSPETLKKLHKHLEVDYATIMEMAGHLSWDELIDLAMNEDEEDSLWREQSVRSSNYKKISYFVNLLIGDREKDFYHSTQTELHDRIYELFEKHNIDMDSIPKITVSDESGIRNDIPEQYVDMMMQVDNFGFQWDALQMLQDLAHEFHIKWNPAYEVGLSQPRPKKLEEIIQNGNITYNGQILEEEDRQRILEMLKLLLKDRSKD